MSDFTATIPTIGILVAGIVIGAILNESRHGWNERRERPTVRPYWITRLEESLVEYQAALNACPDGELRSGSSEVRRVVFAYFTHLRNRSDAGLMEKVIPLIMDWKEMHSVILKDYTLELQELKERNA